MRNLGLTTFGIHILVRIRGFVPISEIGPWEAHTNDPMWVHTPSRRDKDTRFWDVATERVPVSSYAYKAMLQSKFGKRVLPQTKLER